MTQMKVWLEEVDYFFSQRWDLRTCAVCKREFYAKPKNQTKTCKRGSCVDEPLKFLELSKRRLPKSITEIVKDIQIAFVSGGYEQIGSILVNDTNGQTEFIGAGVQAFEPILFGSMSPTSKPIYIF